MSLMRVRLAPARSQDFPEGSQSHGYEFIAPLNKDGHIDASAWKRFDYDKSNDGA